MKSATYLLLTLALLASGCRDRPLRKMDEQTLIDRIASNQLPDPGEITIKNPDGHIISVEALRKLEMTGEYFEDFYVNQENQIVEIVVRKKTEADEAFLKQVNARINAPPKLQNVAVDCRDKANILQEVFNRDQAMRQPGQQIDPQTDLENLEIVVNFLDKCGMPTLEEVNEMQMAGIWGVLQHAHPKYQKMYIPLLETAAEKGDIPRSVIALMRDRALLHEGKPQIYGSQIENGELYKLFEPEYVNQRRAAMGMEPIEEYLKRFGITFEVEQKKRF